jgi:hypothetical protein
VIDPNASASSRVAVSKTILVFVALAAAYVASLRMADILFLVSAAFSFAAAAFFPALTLGIFWKRANKWGASLGMVAGLGISFYYMLKTHPWMYGLFHEGSLTPEILKANTWWDIAPISAGIFGVPLGFAVIIIVSLLTKAPDQEVQDMVENVRFPSFDGTTSQGSADRIMRSGFFMGTGQELASRTLNTHFAKRRCLPVGVIKPGIALQISPQHGQRILAPKHTAINHPAGHAKHPQLYRLLAVRLQGLLDLGTAGVLRRCKLGCQGRQTLGIGGIQPGAPNVAENFLAHITARLAIGITRGGQSQQAQRIEGVHGGQLQRRALLTGQPQRLPVSPVALGRDFCRSQLTVVLEHGGKQHWFVHHAVADALQRTGQGIKTEPRIGRNEIEIEMDGFHGCLPVCGDALCSQVYRVNTNLRGPSCP